MRRVVAIVVSTLLLGVVLPVAVAAEEAGCAAPSLCSSVVIEATDGGVVPIVLEHDATVNIDRSAAEPLGPGQPNSVQSDGVAAGFALVRDGKIALAGMIFHGDQPHTLPPVVVPPTVEDLVLPQGHYELLVIAEGGPVRVELTLEGLSVGTTALDQAGLQPTDRVRVHDIEDQQPTPGFTGGATVTVNEGTRVYYSFYGRGPAVVAGEVVTCVYLDEDTDVKPLCPDANVRSSNIIQPDLDGFAFVKYGGLGMPEGRYTVGGSIEGALVLDHASVVVVVIDP